MTYDDLSVLFGNLMDNAVESAEKTVNPFIELNVFQKEKNNMTIITLIDSCRVNPIDKNGNLLPTKSRIHTPMDSAFLYTLLFSILYEAVNHRNHTIYTELCHIQAQVIVFCLPQLLSGIVFVIGLSVVICLTHNSLCLSH